MNCNTGHLIIEYDKGYVPIPKELEHAAKQKLAGKKEAYVSLTSGGKLSKFAAQNRKAMRQNIRRNNSRGR